MDQKVAMVTGASQGIGKGIALELAKAGYDIALHCSSNLRAAQETAAEINTLGHGCEVIQTDLSHYEGIVELFSSFDRVFDRIDVLVNNAGITVGGPMLEMDIETFDKVNAIAPGFTDTGHPRMGDPERTYNAIPLFLAGDAGMSYLRERADRMRRRILDEDLT